jgi:hypothetical protein
LLVIEVFLIAAVIVATQLYLFWVVAYGVISWVHSLSKWPPPKTPLWLTLLSKVQLPLLIVADKLSERIMERWFND